MAGTLVISEELCWMPAGWAYDNVLELMASGVRDKDEPLAALLLDARTFSNGGYLDLRGTDAARISTLVQAADSAYAQEERAGPGSFHDPAFYPGFLARFRELREMLRAQLREDAGDG